MKKTSLLKINLTLILVLILSSYNLPAQYWTKLEGTSVYINGIFLNPNNPEMLIVASDDVPTDFSEQYIQFPYFGVGQNGFRISTNGGNSFGEPILSSYSVYNIHQAINNNNLWFASVRRFTRGGILISNDGGKIWETENLKCSGNFQISKIISKLNNSNELELYASAVNSDEGFRYSLNKFEDCLTNEALDIQALDIAISPLDKNLMFIPGDGFHNSGVYRSYDNGKTWLKDSSGLINKRVLCVLPSAFNKAWVLCGVDSIDMNKFRYGKGIYLSLDTGKTWKPVGAFGATVFSLAQHPLYPKYIAAACDRQGVYLSGSFGWNWEKFSDGLPKDSSVRQVAIPAIDSTNEGIIVYAGVFADGVYKSKRIKTDVEISQNHFKDIQIVPNPTNGIINLYNLNENYSVYISDILGNRINYDISASSLNNCTIDISSLNDGAYFLHIFSNNYFITKKLIKISK